MAVKCSTFFFPFGVEWNRVHYYWVNLLAYCSSPGWWTMSVEQSVEWLARKTEVLRENLRQCPLSTMKPALPDPVSNPGRHSGKLATEPSELRNGRVRPLSWEEILVLISLRRLWSRGQSSWLQTQSPGFDSRRYLIIWEVVGLERGPLSLVSTIEELLGRKSSGSGL
jgi:hypothetical protein